MELKNSKEILDKLKQYIFSSESKEKEEVKLETAEIVDADVMVEAESFEAGNEVFIIADEERLPLPVGEYPLTDGNVLVVEQEGIIASYGQPSEQVEEEVVEEEQEMESEEKSNPKKVVESVSKEIHFSEDELKTMVKTWFEEFSKEKAEEIEVKEEVELSKESVPAGKAIKHSPESKPKSKQTVLSSNRPMTTVDKILARQLSRN